ncbi:MAG: hypothetical protein JXO72_10195 [Vicinamibacteria bacterium]|nr:hypothetical protein [Vicinamibacteria bacterium]
MSGRRTRFCCRHGLLGVVVSGLIAAVFPASARAAGVVGDGTPASCTESAFNAALAGGGAVTFNCGGGPVVIPITSAKTLTTTTTIDGAGEQITLDGGNTTRMFLTTYQFSSFTLTFRNLTLRNARTTDVGAAIRLAYQDYLTTLNVENVTFSNNVCTQAGPDVGGGAIYAQGGDVYIRNCVFTGNRGGNGGAIGNLQARLTVEDSVFSNNETHAMVGGNGGGGGAIYIDGSNDGLVTIRRSSFIGNASSHLGGAVHAYQYAGGSGVIIEDSTFQNNETYNNGGAIYHQNGALSIARSTFAGNETVGQGGAIWLLEADPAVIANSTFSGNRANGVPGNDSGNTGLGGAILINANNVVTLSHLTIVDNYADWVGGGICGGMESSSTTLRASIVANNVSSTGVYDWNLGMNCSSALIDGGFNLQFPARNPSYYNDSDCIDGITIAEPMLGPLADNGGPTMTHAPLDGSPALNAVTSGCPPPAADQRGVTRPQNGACDAGAHEAGAVGVSAPRGLRLPR